MAAPVTIVGGGLAGCALAWALRFRGREVVLFDRDEERTSTKVAAGMVNPITGPNLTLGWRFAELWPAALDFYARVGAECGAEVFHRLPLLRLLHSDEQAAKWRRRLEAPEYVEIVDQNPAVPEVADARFGGFQSDRAGYLDTAAFIAATRQMLGEDWRAEEYGGDREGGGPVVFCEGLAATKNPLFDWVPFKPAKGEVLTLRSDEIPENRILNRGGAWVLPLGGGLFRSGATYDWGATDPEPTPEGRAEIETRLGTWLRARYEVVDHRAAVRPVIRASRLLMGMHPSREGAGFFNGLGSKGVLSAPFFAGQFAAHLCGEGEIDPEVDLRKNL